MKKAHLLRCAQPSRSNVLSKARLRAPVHRAPCIWSFLIGLQTKSLPARVEPETRNL